VSDVASIIKQQQKIEHDTPIILYEEIQPENINLLDMDMSLIDCELQHGDIICFQLGDFTNFSGSESTTTESVVDNEGRQLAIIPRTYNTVPQYFEYLLDRCDVAFHNVVDLEGVGFSLPLLLSNTYDEIILSVASHLDMEGKSIYLQLYQHSPITNGPRNAPLRHGRYSGIFVYFILFDIR